MLRPHWLYSFTDLHLAMRTRLTIPLLALLVAAAGCSQIEAPPAPISAESVAFIPLIVPDDANPARIILAGADDNWRASYDADQEAAMRDLMAFAAAADSDWQTADALAEETVARWEGTMQEHLVAQQISHRMLVRLVHQPDPSAEQLAAIERHTERLLQWEHPHLPVLLDGIARTGSRWSDARRAEAIATAKAGAERWLAHNPCETCVGQGPSTDASLGARERVILAMEAALPEADRRLERLGVGI
jgi:hypothetical protein